MFPKVEPFKNDWDSGKNRLLIMAEGFEPRTFSFLNNVNDIRFNDTIICRYSPVEIEPDGEKLHDILIGFDLKEDNIHVIPFCRFQPMTFESELRDFFLRNINNYDEVVIDISVMSKLLIMVIIWLLREYPNSIKIIYSEPDDYYPTRENYKALREEFGENIHELTALPSFGVHDVVRTPELTSVVMQQNPNILIAFTSFNELLLRALMSSISPMHFYLISCVPPRLGWREEATQQLHEKLIEDFPNDNPKGCSKNRLQRRSSALYYTETFQVLADLYVKHCYDYRIILAPTGSKMQTLGAALIKCCCPDIHIEYPTPDSYIWDGFSSDKIHAIHQVRFTNLPRLLNVASEYYKLDG